MLARNRSVILGSSQGNRSPIETIAWPLQDYLDGQKTVCNSTLLFTLFRVSFQQTLSNVETILRRGDIRKELEMEVP
jgi:hypothetical protein